MPELDWSDMPKYQSVKADWRTPELLLEGSVNCAKTTLWLDKEIDALLKWAGIKSLLFRWSQDAVNTKLRPAFEELMAIRGIPYQWDNKVNRYELENGSIAYMFGLKAVSMVEQMNKIRGLGVSRAGGDQVEEVAPAVAGELRGRLRPDLTQTTIHKQTFPFQIIFVSNSEDDDFWLSKEFPVDNRIKGRKVVQFSVFDNKHLPQASIDSLLRQYPEDHPQHRTMVLGRRGPRVYGTPVFEGLYRRELHWNKIHDVDQSSEILEAFEFGKQTPVWMCAQKQYSGGLIVLAGVMGLGLTMHELLDIVEPMRGQLYPAGVTVKTCASPMGGGLRPGDRYTLTNVLRTRLKLTPNQPDSRADANASDVRLAMIENLSSYLKGRNIQGREELAISTAEDRFIIASRDGQRFSPFVHHAFEGGYTWDEHTVSVGNKEVKQPREDDKFANIMHALENIELNYCAGLPTEAEQEEKAIQERKSAYTGGAYGQSEHGWMSY